MKDHIILQIPIRSYGNVATAAAINGLDVSQFVQRTVRRHLSTHASTQSTSQSDPAGGQKSEVTPVPAPAPFPAPAPAGTAGMFDGLA